MKRLMITAAMVLAMGASAFAQDKPTEKKSIDAATCGQMWKAHKATAGYVDPGKGERMKAWYDYRKANCSKDRTATAN